MAVADPSQRSHLVECCIKATHVTSWAIAFASLKYRSILPPAGELSIHCCTDTTAVVLSISVQGGRGDDRDELEFVAQHC